MKTRFTLVFLALLLAATSRAQFNWQHTGGPNGGSLSRIYSNDEYAFYPDEYFLYRTSDGMHWEKLPEADIWPLATNGSNLVAQALANYYSNSVPAKLIISHDNGETWTEGNMPPGGEHFSEIVWCSHGIYIPNGQENFIFRSVDEGQTWDSIFPPFQYGYDIWEFDDRLYGSSSSGIWRTDTNGENWTSLTVPLGANEIFAHGQHILVGTGSNIWQSHDEGQTWSNQSKPWAENFTAFQLVGDTVYVAGGGNLARSDDFGESWEVLYLDDTYQFYFFYMATAGGQILGSTYNIGVLRWDEASGTIVQANEGLGSGAVYNLAAGGNRVWAGAGNGVFQYDLSQENWSANSPLPIPEHFYESIATNDNGLVCAAEWLTDHFFLSTDFGQSWDTIYPFTEPWDFGYIYSLMLSDEVIFLWNDLENFLWRSDDLGQNWEQVDAPFFIGSIIKFNGLLLGYSNQQIYSSSDLGMTWEVFSDFPYGNIHSMYTSGDRLMIGYYINISGQYHRRLYTSTDGINWAYAHDGLPEVSLYIDPSSEYYLPGFYYYQEEYFLYAPSIGFFVSQDSCKTWLPLEHRNWYAVTMADGKFYAGSFGGGVIRADVPVNAYGELAEGMVYLDENNNGVFDAGENPIPNVRVSAEQPGTWYPFYFTTTAEDGSWSLGITPGLQDTLRPLIQSPHLESINPPWYLANMGGTGKDFGIHLTPGITDLSVAGGYIFRPRPGFDFRIYAHYANDGTTDPGAVVSLKLDPNLTYLQATPSPTAIFGDSLVWDVGQLPVLNGGNIWVETNVPATTPLGTLVKSTWHISSIATDATPDNNLLVLCDTVVGSYDPNEKRVQPAEGLTEAEIAEGNELLYTIQFQNTGNYPAERVRITDMIDTALYLPSLRFVAASHPVTSFQLRPGGLLEVVFDNIQLFGSTSDEAASHGFITFAVQRKKAFDLTYRVRNMAAIYFDFNEPVFTNEVSFTINDTPVAVRETPGQAATQLLIFPNPAEREFTIFSNGQLHGSGTMTLQNETGQILLQLAVADLGRPLTVQAVQLPDGLYFVHLSGDTGRMAGKVVILTGRK